jgi:DNA-directed RNA polymerase specialized sigma subunit
MKNSLGPVFRNQRILSRPELIELFNGKENDDLEERNRIIHDAFKLYAYTQSEIADFLSLSSSAISKVICKSN